MQRGKSGKILLFFSILTFLLGGCGKVMEEIEQSLPEVVKPMMDNEEAEVDKYSICYEADTPCIFAYSRLSQEEQLWYEDINRLLAYRMDEAVTLSPEGLEQGLTQDDIDKIYNCVMMDHPEYFFVEGYEYTIFTHGEKVVGIEMNGTYGYSAEECKMRLQELELAAEQIVNNAPVNGEEYEKIRYIYETIILQTDYDLKAPDNQNIYSVLIGKSSVCQGYAKATQYLLNQLGIESSVVFGHVGDGEYHSWNIVKCNGKYYHMDTTWGDASYTMNGEMLNEVEAPEINYDYLCITTEQIEQTHAIKDVVELPECDSIEDNYYVREGKYFCSFDEAQLEREFKEAFENGENVVTIKCDVKEIYDIFYEELINNQQIFSYLPEEYESISFIDDEEQLTLSFWVTK